MTNRFSHVLSTALGGGLLGLLASCGAAEERTLPVYREPVEAGPRTTRAAPRGAVTPEVAAAAGGLTAAKDAAKSDAAVPAEAAAQGAARPEATREPARAALLAEADRVVDDWHDAASVGDRDRYLGHFSPDAVFLGTDGSERWDLASFTAYVEENMRPGSGWPYTPSERHVTLGPNAQVAWFDESLARNDFKSLRGTGALRRSGDTWHIVHYSMTYAVPNDIRSDLEDMVRAIAR